MKVILLEKPSMLKKYKEALKGEKDLKFVSSIGHIEELAPPEHYLSNGEKIYWNKLVKKFPFVPEKFILRITNQRQYDLIKRDIAKAEEIILACDPDREGETIHRNILELLQSEGLVKTDKITRVWLHSETKLGIQKGYKERKHYMEYDGYHKAARARAMQDWLIGIQLSVLYSVKYSKPGIPISIGRIQTWLLSEIVKRSLEFKNFVPQDYWNVYFLTKDNVKFNLVDEEKKILQIFEKEKVKNIENDIRNEKLKIENVEIKKFKEYAPSLYDMNALQKDAAKRYKLSPDKTLKIAQKLYEDKELISYPRTDCNIISEEEAKEVKNSINLVRKFPKYKSLVDEVDKINPNYKLRKKYIGKIKGHYAIIPVLNYAKQTIPKLSEDEKKIFDLIVMRFIAVFLEPVSGEKTKIDASIKTYPFFTEIKNIRDYGYKKIIKSDKDDNDAVSVDYKKDDLLDGKLELSEDKTKAKPLFKDASILSMMEKAHLMVEDKVLKEALKDASGIGTAATRSSFIPILLKREYIKQDNGNYIPTDKGYKLYKVIPKELQTADFSANLEFELSKYIDGKGKEFEEMLAETKKFLTKVFNKVNGKIDLSDKKYKSYGKCPKCGGNVIKGRKGYGCSNWQKGCHFVIWVEKNGVILSGKNIKELLENKKTSLITGFVSKRGKKFDAYLVLNENLSVSFEFPEKTDLIVGKCPICNKNVIQNKLAYSCEAWKEGCKFTIWRNFSHRNISIKEANVLLSEGETDILDGFKDKDGNEYSAKLKIIENKVEKILKEE